MQSQRIKNGLGTNSPRDKASIWVVVGATTMVFLMATATRLALISHYPLNDELYHVLAARSLLEFGEPRILHGVYERALEYTWLIAGVFSIFGESLEAGRLTSVVFGSALVACIFAWVRHLAGWLAGLVAAVLAIFWPTGILVSQFIRFYALFGLLSFLGFIVVYAAVYEARKTWTRTLLALLVTLLFGLALNLQIVMLIGLVGLGVWFFLFVLLPAIAAHRNRKLIGLGLLGISFAAAAFMWHMGIWESLLTRFRWTPEWAASRQNQELYYYRALARQFPKLWPWLPFAAIIAIARYPKPGLFCAVVFGVSLLLHSLAGSKDERYIYYIFPLDVRDLWNGCRRYRSTRTQNTGSCQPVYVAGCA